MTEFGKFGDFELVITGSDDNAMGLFPRVDSDGLDWEGLWVEVFEVGDGAVGVEDVAVGHDRGIGYAQDYKAGESEIYG